MVLPPEEKLRLLSMVDILEPLTREEIEELSILVPDTHFQRARQADYNARATKALLPGSVLCYGFDEQETRR
jgi:hypothetical protein